MGRHGGTIPTSARVANVMLEASVLHTEGAHNIIGGFDWWEAFLNHVKAFMALGHPKFI